MSKVVLDVAMSLGGFTAGPNVGEAEPMGEGGERLHGWMWMAGNGPDGGVDIGFRTVDAMVGAAVIGRRTFDLGVGPWGGTPWPGVPSFVVTHRTRGGPARRQRRDVRLRWAGGRGPGVPGIPPGTRTSWC